MMLDKEEGEDIEDALMKNIYKEQEIEDITKIRTYKDIDFLGVKNRYKTKFNESLIKDLNLHKQRIYSMDWLNNDSKLNLITGSYEIKLWDLNRIINSSNKQNYSSNLEPVINNIDYSSIYSFNNISSKNI